MIGTIRDGEKMPAVKKLMLESLLNFRLHGTTMSHDQLLMVLQNIVIDKVAIVPTSRIRKIDTSAPMEIAMAARDDGGKLKEEGDQGIVDLSLQAVRKGAGKGKWSFGNGQSWNEK